MTQTIAKTTITPGNEDQINPLGRFVLAHNGSEWNGSFLGAVNYVLTREVEDGPVSINVLVEHFDERKQEIVQKQVSGSLIALNHRALSFEDGVTVETGDILAVWY